MHRHLVRPLTLLVMVLTLTSSVVWAHEAGWPGKRLSEVFPKAKTFKPRQVTLTPAQIARIEKAAGAKIGVEDKVPTFYVAYIEDKEAGKEVPAGAVVFIDAVGARGNMEVNVAVTLKGKLHSVSLWKHKESKAVESKDFLKQFNDKKKITDPFKVGEDIVAADGAEKASQTVATATKKGWFMFQEVFGKKKADAEPEKEEHHDHGDAGHHSDDDGHHDEGGGNHEDDGHDH